MTKTQKRNARKRRAAGRIVHHDIELSLLRDECSGPFPGYDEKGWFHSCLRSTCSKQWSCTGCSNCPCEGMDVVTTSVHLDTIATNASGPEADLLDRLRRAYEFCRKQFTAGSAPSLEVAFKSTNGSEVKEGELKWLVGTTDVETVVADVIAAVFMQDPSLSLATSSNSTLSCPEQTLA